MTLNAFEKKANTAAHTAKGSVWALHPSEVEKMFWRKMMSGDGGSVEYGDNMDGTAFSTSANDPLGCSDWNLTVGTLNYVPPNPLR